MVVTMVITVIPPGDHHNREAGVSVKGNGECDKSLGVAVTRKNGKKMILRNPRLFE